MYIQIKQLKKILLISACIFFAGFNYLTYVKADSLKSGDQKSCDKVADSDCDGLTNSEEALYGTDANKADSDGDGYSDGVEVKSGYDPARPAPGDKISTKNGDISTGTAAAASSVSMTEELAQELKKYTQSKGGQAITTTDIQSFMDSNLAAKFGTQLTWETLPEIDSQQILVLKQSYGSLSDTERQLKLQQDAATYITRVSYLFASNLPVAITSEANLQTYGLEFQKHMATLSATNPDIEYFSDLGNRLELFSSQLSTIEVPETALPLHTKLLRLIGGFLTLRELNSPTQDPVAQSIMLSKVQNLTSLFIAFFENDFQGYINQMRGTQK